MTDTGTSAAIPTPDSAATQAAKKSRGRPKKDTAPETPQQRIDQLKAELEKAQEALREFEARRDSIVGKAVVAHARANPDYGKQLADLLRREVTGKSDLAVIGDLLE